jgi:hypothetical protein
MVSRRLAPTGCAAILFSHFGEIRIQGRNDCPPSRGRLPSQVAPTIRRVIGIALASTLDTLNWVELYMDEG